MKPIEETLKPYYDSKELEDRQFVNTIRTEYKDEFVLDFYDEIFKNIFNDKEKQKQVLSILSNKIPKEYLENYSGLLSPEANKIKLINFLKEYPENFIIILFNKEYLDKCVKRIVTDKSDELQENLRDEDAIKWIYYRNVEPPVFEENKKVKKIEIKKTSELVSRKDKVVYIDKLTRINIIKNRMEILNINGDVIEEIPIHKDYGGYMDYYVKYLRLINSGQKVLFEDFKGKFSNFKYLMLNIDDIREMVNDDDCFDDVITDMLMSNIDLSGVFEDFENYEDFVMELIGKIRYLKYKYNLEQRLRVLLIEGITIDKFGEFCDRMKKGKFKDKLNDKQLLELYKQIADKGGRKFNLDLSLKYLERVQYQKEFMEIIKLADSKKLVPLLRNIILNRETFAEFYDEYKTRKKKPGLPDEVVRDSQGRLQLRGTSHFAVEYDANYTSTKAKLVFSNGEVIYVDKVNLKSKYNKLFKDVMRREVLCAKLAKQFRINSTPYDIALYEDDEALVREEYDENGELITGDKILNDKNEMDIANILNQTEEFLNKNNIKESDIEQLKIDFLKMVLFDKLVNQTSRSNNDWAIVLSKDNAKFAPLFNNGNCFNLPNSGVNQNSQVAQKIERNKKMINEIYNKNNDFVMSIRGEKDLNAFLNEYFSQYPDLEMFIRKNIEYIDLDKAAREIYKEKGLFINISKYTEQFIANTELVKNFISEKDIEKTKNIRKHQNELVIELGNQNDKNNSTN